MRILQADVFGDSNIGLYGKSSDSVCFIGRGMPDKVTGKIESVLKTKVVGISVLNTEFVGMLCAINSNGIVLPKHTNEKEFDMIQSEAKKLGMNVVVLKSKFTAVGNLVLCNDRGAAVSNLISKTDMDSISDVLGVETEHIGLAGLKNVGACGVATNKGCIVHRDADSNEVDSLKEILKVNVDIGTANFGSPFVGGCAIANKNGLIVGSQTTGPEIARMMETLDLL